ncbi:polysaccharide biosynthesis protein [Clostridium tarantellae]|uniref:NAD-dependent epimerase/dehydratase family protein n=1 Tax=Clostridium tarantellae TaxID=39493 RepID=A0A6I1MIR0_9CLOT|nr:nucleoside-diphosphate sugar epimerase/dehydratase [Clostridium tarantellae]MPQ42288.1 NAD-dependent epimerase/dehydratase family protein [Clostridium tarantellae]
MKLAQKTKVILLLFMDIFLISIAYLFSLYIRFAADVPAIYMVLYFKYMAIILALYIIPLYIFKMYKSLWSTAGIDEAIQGGTACFIGMTLSVLVMFILPSRIPVSVNILSGILITFSVIGARLSFRVYRRLIIYKDYMYSKDKGDATRVLVVGAGSCAQMIHKEFANDPKGKYKLIGFMDDNRNKVGTYLAGVKVLGTREDIKIIAEEKKIDLILIAIPSLKGNEKKEIIEKCQEAKVKTQIIPSVYELIGEKVNLKQARDVDLRDLLGREEVKLDKDGIKDYIHGKTVLVTGGGGSIGSELCRQIAQFSPKLLLILDIYENNAYDLQNELKRKFPTVEQQVLIATVRDKKRMRHIFRQYKPNVVFHAAAHKHVPLMEFNPGEAIKNNVVGTLNVAECAHRYNSDKFVLISTDKAVNPTNVMGATKRMCEMIVQAINKVSETEFVAVRFGNVLGSNGSVIPLFKKQIEEGGPITLTDMEITRYFMLIPEASQLVLQAGAYAKGGEIFVLDMGKPVKIYDLARDLIKLSGYEPDKDIKIKVTGLRPGEKLYEELLMDEEGLKETQHEKIFIGKPGDFNLDRLKLGIKALLDISEKDDKETIKVALAQIVKTYKRLDKKEEEEELVLRKVFITKLG